MRYPAWMGTVAGIRVIAISPKSTLRKRLREVLRRDRDLRLVGLASDDDDGAALVRSLQPHVALWDPGHEGLLCGNAPLPAAIRSVIALTRVLLCGHSIDPSHAVAVASLGFWGSIAADERDDLLINAIHSVSRGELWIGRKTLSQAFLELVHSHHPQRHDSAPLSVREDEVAICVSHGLTNKEIAKRLGISDKTVKTHIHRILNKRQLRNRVLLALSEAEADNSNARPESAHWDSTHSAA